MRPPRFESQEESSCSVLHRAHTPRTAIGNVLMARLMTILWFLVKRQPAAAAVHLWRVEEPSRLSLENLRHEYELGSITNSAAQTLNKLYVGSALLRFGPASVSGCTLGNLRVRFDLRQVLA